MILLSVLVLIFSFVVWAEVKSRRKRKLLSKIPSRKKKFILENAMEFYGKSSKEILDLFVEMKNELGSVYHYSFSSFDPGYVMISDPKLTELVLSSPKLIDKGYDYDVMKDWLGNGLIMSTGRKWQQTRKILTPAFHFQILEKFVEIMDEQCKVLLGKLVKTRGKEVDVFPFVSLFALDVICESAMGRKINAQQLSDSEYVKAVKGVTEIFFKRNIDLLLRSDLIYPFTAIYREEKRLLKIINGFTDSVIKAKREEFLKRSKPEEKSDETGIKRRLALMDLLFQAKINGKPLSDSDIRDEVKTFMFAGHDTTTVAISFCLLNIAKHPEVQQNIFEEFDSIKADNEDNLTIKDLNGLQYLEKVIKESLRIYPSIVLFARRMPEDVTVGEYTFPKNCNLYFSPYLMGRDAKLFPDPLEFKPERFDVEASKEKVNPFAFVPFSAGPRNCIGQKFAMVEIKLTIARIVQKFEIKVTKENENPEVHMEVVLKAENGVNLSFNERKSTKIE